MLARKARPYRRNGRSAGWRGPCSCAPRPAPSCESSSPRSREGGSSPFRAIGASEHYTSKLTSMSSLSAQPSSRAFYIDGFTQLYTCWRYRRRRRSPPLVAGVSLRSGCHLLAAICALPACVYAALHVSYAFAVVSALAADLRAFTARVPVVLCADQHEMS